MARPDPRETIESLSALARCLRAAAAKAYASMDADVGSAQAKFLRHIGRHGGISQAELARATATAPTLTGRALATLIARGWVRRTRSAQDRREYTLELTAAGQRTRMRVERARGKIADRVAAALDDRDLDDFHRVATKILAAFEGSSLL